MYSLNFDGSVNAISMGPLKSLWKFVNRKRQNDLNQCSNVKMN